MGDPKLSILPPGCRFCPSDEQLLRYYLTHKNNGDRTLGLGFDVIKEIDLYGFEPVDLPDSTCFRYGKGGRKRHYYCYVARVLREEVWRRAGCGYWRRSGSVRDVVGGGAGKVILGTRSSFVFYLGNSPKSAVKTDWIMYEYALIEHQLPSFVLCRVLVKSQRNNRPEHPLLSSCGEESFAALRDIGVQHDGTIKSINGEANNMMADNSPPEHMNVLVMRYPNPVGLVSELDNNNVTIAPVGLQKRTSGHSSDREMNVDSLTAEQLVIFEEDYLELDDLTSPLPGAID